MFGEVDGTAESSGRKSREWGHVMHPSSCDPSVTVGHEWGRAGGRLLLLPKRQEAVWFTVRSVDWLDVFLSGMPGLECSHARMASGKC